MGQYYKVAFKRRGEDKVIINDRKYRGSGYVLAKLMEHSYIGNHFCDAVAAELQRNACKIAWVGDYAEEDEMKEITRGEVSHSDVWGDNVDDRHEFPTHKFSYKGKFLVNHDKQQYISFDKYIKDSKDAGIEWEINPISLLTAVGNGRGGGDYFGLNEDEVGIWAWDTLEMSEKEPVGYMKATVLFKERYEK